MSDSPRAPLRTLLEIHRRRLDALAPADLHSIIVEAPEAAPPTFASQEDPDAGDPDFLPLPPRLSRKARLDSQELAGSPHEEPFEGRLVYLGDGERLREYHRVATDLSQVLSDHYASIFDDQGPAPSDGGNSTFFAREISMIYLLDSVGHAWAGHAWTLAVHRLLGSLGPKSLAGRYAWWTRPRSNDLPARPEEEFERFADFHLVDSRRRPGIVAAYVLKNDLVTSSVMAIDAILEGPDLAGERPRAMDSGVAGMASPAPSRPPAGAEVGEPILQEANRTRENLMDDRSVRTPPNGCRPPRPFTPCERWVVSELKARGRRTTQREMMVLGAKVDPSHGQSTTRKALGVLKKVGVLTNESRDPGDGRGHGFGLAEWS